MGHGCTGHVSYGPRVELYQAEWCPHSHRVRQRLTELGIDFVARQVPADPDDRETMRTEFGETSIPVLVTDDGDAIAGDDAILDYLQRFDERPDASRHRAKARVEVPEFDELEPRVERRG